MSAPGVDAGDRSAAGTDGVHVEGGHPDREARRQAARPPAPGDRRGPGTRPCSFHPCRSVTHRGSRSPLAATAAAARRRRPDPKGGARLGGRPPCAGDEAAGRRHHQHLGRRRPARRGRPTHRPQVRVDDRRDGALVLVELRATSRTTGTRRCPGSSAPDRPLARVLDRGRRAAGRRRQRRLLGHARQAVVAVDRGTISHPSASSRSPPRSAGPGRRAEPADRPTGRRATGGPVGRSR